MPDQTVAEIPALIEETKVSVDKKGLDIVTSPRAPFLLVPDQTKALKDVAPAVANEPRALVILATLDTIS